MGPELLIRLTDRYKHKRWYLHVMIISTLWVFVSMCVLVYFIWDTIENLLAKVLFLALLYFPVALLAYHCYRLYCEIKKSKH